MPNGRPEQGGDLIWKVSPPETAGNAGSDREKLGRVNRISSISKWKICPMGWQGSFSGKSKKPTIVLEAVNDITVLALSPLFEAVTAGKAPQLNQHVNGTSYEFGYYLADGIYHKWVTVVQSIKHPENDAEVYFSTKQEAYRKDVKRAFEFLQARFAIIRQPAV
ncbi:uncharacterized protein LOC112184194 [Rosa chinensis]|uniref:uncharacterized protein LOC112184194 n=1 Tax=Rosa chinensis TaxID=74649 RepID=UPI000D0971D6|nr:uncharacterized protein LOC112184194 [Rosa chinensis]